MLTTSEFPSEGLMKVIVDRHGADSQKIHQDIKKYKDLRRDLFVANADVAKEEARHVKALKELRERCAKATKDCDHPIKTFHPDPSGNNDSYYECDICGVEL